MSTSLKYLVQMASLFWAPSASYRLDHSSSTIAHWRRKFLVPLASAFFSVQHPRLGDKWVLSMTKRITSPGTSLSTSPVTGIRQLNASELGPIFLPRPANISLCNSSAPFRRAVGRKQAFGRFRPSSGAGICRSSPPPRECQKRRGWFSHAFRPDGPDARRSFPQQFVRHKSRSIRMPARTAATQGTGSPAGRLRRPTVPQNKIHWVAVCRGGYFDACAGDHVVDRPPRQRTHIPCKFQRREAHAHRRPWRWPLGISPSIMLDI